MKKGFTLVELLAVIAILAILVIIAMPNVIKMFRNAQKRAFLSEVQTLSKETVNKVVLSNYNNIILDEIRNDDEDSNNDLNLSGRELDYCFKLDNSGEVIFMQVSNGKFQVRTTKYMEELTIDDVKEGEYSNFKCIIPVSIVEEMTTLLNSDGTRENIDLRDGKSLDFSNPADTEEESGLFFLNNETTDENNDGNSNEVLFYRGIVENNYLVYAGFCWRIVRTNENGSVKIRYNGKYENGECPTTGSDVSIHKDVRLTEDSSDNGRFNYYIDENGTADSQDNAYVGYMYGTPNSNSYDETHSNKNDSNIKKVIDKWYEENILTKNNRIVSKISDTIYCNDRQLFAGLGTTTEHTTYMTWKRLESSQPSYVCKQENDRFSVNTTTGNGDLKYPIALLTADELVFAGGIAYLNNKGNNTKYFLHMTGNNGKNATYWTLSPFAYSCGYKKSRMRL